MLWEGIQLEAAVYESDFTENGLTIWYYEDPDYQGLNQDETPANVEALLFV